MSVSDYETLLENLRRQRQLYARVDKLHYYRSELGMTSLAEIDEYVRAKQERKLTKPKRYSYLLGLSKRVTRGGSRASSPNKSCGGDAFDFAGLPSKRPYVKRKNSSLFGTAAATSSSAASTNGSATNGHAKNGNGHAKRGRKPKNPPVQAPAPASLANFDEDIYDDEEESNNDEIAGEEADEEESDVMDSIENSEPEDDAEDEDNEVEDDDEEEEDEDADELDDSNSTEQGDEEDESDVETTTSSSGSAVYELNEDNVVCRLRRLTSRSSSINNSSVLNVSPKSSAATANAGVRNGKITNTSRLSPIKKNKAVVAAAAALIKKLKKPLKNNSQLVNSGRRTATANGVVGVGRKRKRAKLSNSRNDGRTERVCSMPGYNLLSENEKKVNKQIKQKLILRKFFPTKTRNRI